MRKYVGEYISLHMLDRVKKVENGYFSRLTDSVWDFYPQKEESENQQSTESYLSPQDGYSSPSFF